MKNLTGLRLAAVIALLYLLGILSVTMLDLAGLQGPVCHHGTAQQHTCRR